jgi:hypothetical protein
MHNTPEDPFDALLRSRAFEPARPDLAERIILTARSLPQQRRLTLHAWIQRLFAEFHVPRPAYALALVLMLGFVLGVSLQGMQVTEGYDPMSIQSFLYAEEEVL